MTWRQLPHGVHRSPSRHTTATVSILRMPSAAAVVMALASAQMVAPNAAFSIFAPRYSDPSAATATAPTRNFEYGEYDRLAASVANARSSSWVLIGPGP